MKTALVAFGGVSAEHEVSVVTGLQALEKVDRTIFDPLVLYITKKGEIECLPGLSDRYGFASAKRISASVGRDAKGGYVQLAGLMGKKIYPYAAFLAFHGGSGESGPLQGLLESVSIPHTGSTVEGSVIAMNKALAKETMRAANVSTLSSVRIYAHAVHADVEASAKGAIEALTLPVIVKPAHLGSSIGIKVAKTDVELQKALLEASHMDTEIMVEPFLSGITEYNCAVRERADGTLEASEVERPLGQDAILSFADKYERGGKKQGGGMATLARELPAKIAPEKKREIQELAMRVYRAARLAGMGRLDFMQSAEGALYLTEINPIPGSLAYYLWEASGIPYQTQITEAIEAAVARSKRETERVLDYKSDIIERFTKKA